MKVSITSIELKGPFKFFLLASQALKITRQLQATTCKDFSKRGFWTTHYTMTLWDNETDLKEFAKSGAHREAMRKSAEIAKEIWTLTYDADKLPSWEDAKKLLKKGKVMRF